MGKVLVERELLEEAAKWLEVHSSSSGSAEAFAAESLREAIAQPAEAEGVEVRCDICGGTGAADSGGIQPCGEAIYVDCECIAKQEQFAGKLGALKKAAKGACSYSEEDWFRPENLWSCMEKDDAAFVSAASPFALLALIAAYERISAALSAVTAERDRLAVMVEDLELALEHAEGRAESAGRNSSAFEDCMGDLQVENGKLSDALDQLRAEVEALRKDAERMDWIEENYTGDGGGNHFNMRLRFERDIEDFGGSARGIIDAALAAKEPTK